MKARIALPEIDLGYLPAVLAQTTGQFEELGLQVELIAMRGAQEGIDALLKGHVDFVMSIGPALPAIWEGNKLKVLVQMAKTHCFHLVAQENISGLSDLGAKKIGVGLGGMTFIFACEIAAQSGIKEELYVNIPGGAAKLAALKDGTIAAAVLAAPFHFKALGESVRELSFDKTELGDVPFTGLVAKESYIRRNTDTVTSIVKAIVAAIREVKTNRSAVEDVLESYFGITGDVTNTYEAINSSFDPELTEKRVQGFAAIVAKYTDRRRTAGYQYTDLRFLKKALKGGSQSKVNVSEKN
jgi:ABC-type nitrate/sulfonate/bicarbonate transport system substrate-binding protein